MKRIAFARSAGCSSPRAKRRRAFTLLEMILVISTILFLLSVLVAVAGSVHSQAQKQATRQTIRAVESALDEYDRLFGRFPPPDYGGWKIHLYDYLTEEQYGKPMATINEVMIERALWGDDEGEPYFVDAYRNAIQYLPFKESARQSGVSRNLEDDRKKWCMNGGRPLVWSLGPDGRGWTDSDMRRYSSTALRQYLYLDRRPNTNEDNITNFRDIPLEFIR
jgi:type II secretory pathway pseudopilin PulG